MHKASPIFDIISFPQHMLHLNHGADKASLSLIFLLAPKNVSLTNKKFALWVDRLLKKK